MQFVHSSWGAKEGAPRNIQAITQTKDGYLWLGSAEGLFRFDGVVFEHYETSAGPPLPSGAARFLLALPNGDLWIAFYSGAVSLLKNGTARTYTKRDGVPDGHALCLALDRERAIWVGTSGGLGRFQGNRWERVGRDWSFPGRSAQALYLDQKGTLWVATEDTLVFLPAGARTFHSTSIHVGLVMQIVEAPNGKLWMAETTRSVRPIPLGTSLKPSDQTEVRVGSQGIFFARDGDLWITTVGDGMRRVPSPEDLTGKPGRFSPLIESYQANDGLSDDVAQTVFQDAEGNMWVGTGRGLDRFRKPVLTTLRSLITRRHDTDQQADLVPGNSGDVWIAANNGVARLHEFRIYPVSYPAGPTLAGYRALTGTIWWVSQDALVLFEHGQFFRFPLPSQLKLPFNYPVNVTEDQTGVLWASFGREGLFRWSNGIWTRIDTPRELTKLIPATAFTDGQGRVWFGYSDGTIIYLQGGRIRTVCTERDSAVGAVRVIGGQNGQVWVGGASGLAFFDGSRLCAISPADAATFGAMSGMEETADGSLWLREWRGVVHVNAGELRRFLKTMTYRVHYDLFDSLDGLPGTFESIGQKEILDTNGRLWFVATHGIAWVNPESVSNRTLPPRAFVRSVIADGRRFASKINLMLPARTTSLQIEYEAVNLSIPERVRYRYELEGVDGSWQDAGVRRVAFYTNLGPGKHRFHVNACNLGGEWNSDTVLDFSVAPAWFQTIWFRSFSGIIFLTLLWAVYRYRIYQIAREFNVRLEERVSERTRLARDLHDTLLQSFQGFILRLQAAEELLPPGRVKAQLEQILERADQAIAEGRQAVYNLRSPTMTTNDLSQALTSVANELAGEGSPTFGLLVEGPVRDLHPILRDEVYRIAREGLRNAFSHARAHRIEAEIVYGEQLFQLRIRDDGDGIAAAILEAGRTGHYGLSGMRERATQVGAKLEIWSGVGKGTEIDLRIPGSIAYSRSPGRPRLRLFRSKSV